MYSEIALQCEGGNTTGVLTAGVLCDSGSRKDAWGYAEAGLLNFILCTL